MPTEINSTNPQQIRLNLHFGKPMERLRRSRYAIVSTVKRAIAKLSSADPPIPRNRSLKKSILSEPETSAS